MEAEWRGKACKLGGTSAQCAAVYKRIVDLIQNTIAEIEQGSDADEQVARLESERARIEKDYSPEAIKASLESVSRAVTFARFHFTAAQRRPLNVTTPKCFKSALFYVETLCSESYWVWNLPPSNSLGISKRSENLLRQLFPFPYLQVVDGSIVQPERLLVISQTLPPLSK
jgi:hypothetical protein